MDIYIDTFKPKKIIYYDDKHIIEQFDPYIITKTDRITNIKKIIQHRGFFLDPTYIHSNIFYIDQMKLYVIDMKKNDEPYQLDKITFDCGKFIVNKSKIIVQKISDRKSNSNNRFHIFNYSVDTNNKINIYNGSKIILANNETIHVDSKNNNVYIIESYLNGSDYGFYVFELHKSLRKYMFHVDSVIDPKKCMFYNNVLFNFTHTKKIDIYSNDAIYHLNTNNNITNIIYVPDTDNFIVIQENDDYTMDIPQRPIIFYIINSILKTVIIDDYDYYHNKREYDITIPYIEDDSIKQYKFNVNGKNTNIFKALMHHKEYFEDKNYNKYIVKFKLFNLEKCIYDQIIDAGGVRKIIFHELTKYIESTFFVIDTESQLYSFNVQYITTYSDNKKKELNFLGVLYKYALAHNHTINIKLDPVIIYCLLYGQHAFENVTLSKFIDFIKESDNNILGVSPWNNLIQDQYKYPKFKSQISNTNNDLHLNWSINDIPQYNNNNNNNNINYRSNSHPREIKFTPEKYFIQVKKIFYKNKWAYDEFANGFNNTSLLFKIKYNMKLFNDYMLGVTDLNLTVLKEHLKCVNFDDRQKDYLFEIFKLCVEECQNEKLWISQFLIAVTGINTIPTNGYMRNPLTVRLRDITNMYGDIEIPLALSSHTCANELEINKTLFNEKMNDNVYDIDDIFLMNFKYDQLKLLSNKTDMA